MPTPPNSFASQHFFELLPKHLDESRDAAGFEDGEKALPVVGEVVQRAGSAASRLHVARVLHRPHDG